MPEGPTTFRKTLVAELATVIDATEVDPNYVRVTSGFVEEKRDLLCEFLDYYTDDLLAFAPFADEFTRDELDGIRTFVRRLDGVVDSPIDWAAERARASALLEALRR